MGYILLAIVIAVISIILVIFAKDDAVRGIFIIIIGLDLVLSGVLSINTVKSSREIDGIIETYNNLKAQIEVVNSSDDKILRNAIIPDLQKRVDAMNNTIVENNSRKDNWWSSVFYCERIGELEPLKIIY